MLFNCIKCAKTISSKTIKCPYCAHNVARVGTQIERATKGLNARQALKDLRGTVAQIRLGAQNL